MKNEQGDFSGWIFKFVHRCYESEDMMNRFLIVDGSNLLFQMFFGMPARIVNKQGKAIQGTLGFVGALLKIIRRIPARK